MKKKDIKLISILSILVISTLILSACSLNKEDSSEANVENQENNKQSQEGVNKMEIDYMSEEEKKNIGIDVEKTVQVLDRNEEGFIMGYKVIEDDDDLIATEEELESILNADNQEENTVNEEGELIEEEGVSQDNIEEENIDEGVIGEEDGGEENLEE